MKVHHHLVFLLIVVLSIKSSASKIPNILWTYWNTPLPSLSQNPLFAAFEQNHIKNSEGWQLRHIDNETVQKWIDQIPELSNVYKRDQWAAENQAKKSDILRIGLIYHFGGVYADFTTVFTSNLDWVLDLVNVAQVQNKYGDEPDLLLLHSSEHGSKQRYIEPGSSQSYLLLPTFESFFMAGKPKNKFCQDWLNFIIQNKKLSYQKYGANSKKSLILDIAESEKIQKGGYKTSYFQVLIGASIVLQRKQRQLDADWKPGTTITRQLAVKHYNIWEMGTNASAYLGINTQQQTSVLAQTDIDFLKQINLYPPYFLKLNRLTMNKLQNFLIPVKKQQQINASNSEEMGIQSIENGGNRQSLARNNFIIETSLLRVHLLRDQFITFYANQLISKETYLELCKAKYFVGEIKRIKDQMEENEIKKFVQVKELRQKMKQLQQQNRKNYLDLQDSKTTIQQLQLQKLQLHNQLSTPSSSPNWQPNPCPKINESTHSSLIVVTIGQGFIIVILICFIFCQKKKQFAKKPFQSHTKLGDYQHLSLRTQHLENS